MKLLRFTDDHARSLLANGEFPREVLQASPRVALVLTQSWCPQWTHMSSYLGVLEDRDPEEFKDLTVWEYLYDQSPLYGEFMDYKERVLGNDLIPYIRYYVRGELVKTTNYVGESQFLAVFKGR